MTATAPVFPGSSIDAADPDPDLIVTVTARPMTGQVRLRVFGEIDLVTRQRWGHALDHAGRCALATRAGGGPATPVVILDLSGVTFLRERCRGTGPERRLG